jgi:ferredoxin
MDPETFTPVVDEDKCTACGACAKACPRRVIELRNKGNKGRRVFVRCINKEKGAVAMKTCKNACIGCGKCAKVCPFEAITVTDNVAYIDFTKCKACRKCVLECPTHAITDVNFPAPAKKPEAPKPAEAPAAPAPEAPKPEAPAAN